MIREQPVARPTGELMQSGKPNLTWLSLPLSREGHAHLFAGLDYGFVVFDLVS